jgi:hypothetical protein
MNIELPWIEIIVEEEEEKDFTIPFFPQEYEDDKDDLEECGLLQCAKVH